MEPADSEKVARVLRKQGLQSSGRRMDCRFRPRAIFLEEKRNDLYKKRHKTDVKTEEI